MAKSKTEVGRPTKVIDTLNSGATPTPVDPGLDGPGSATGAGYFNSPSGDRFFTNPWNMGISRYAGDREDRALLSPSETFEGVGIQLHEDSSYDSNWEHGVRGNPVARPAGFRPATRWTPKGGGRIKKGGNS